MLALFNRRSSRNLTVCSAVALCIVFVVESSFDSSAAVGTRQSNASLPIPAHFITPTQDNFGIDFGAPVTAAPPLILLNQDKTDKARAVSCLAEAVYYEAGSESIDGQRAVAQVVLNRLRHPSFPKSICGVVYEGAGRKTGCQFTFTCDGSLARTPSVAGWFRAAKIAREALSGVVYGAVGHATHYHAAWMTPYWASSVKLVGLVGGHIFYQSRGRGGDTESFRIAYSGYEPLLDKARFETIPSASNSQSEQLGEINTMIKPSTVKTESYEAAAKIDNFDLLGFKVGASQSNQARIDADRVERSLASALSN